jgi:hypothetical protein
MTSDGEQGRVPGVQLAARPGSLPFLAIDLGRRKRDLVQVLDPLRRKTHMRLRLFTFRLTVLVSLVLAAAANGGWKWH